MDKKIREQIHEMLDLVLDINGIQASNRKETGDHPTAFFQFNGNVGGVDASIYSNGWGSGHPGINLYCPVCRAPYASTDENSMEEAVQVLKAAKKFPPQTLQDCVDMHKNRLAVIVHNGEVKYVAREQGDWRG